MILFYFPNKTIHHTIPGFGAVTEQNGAYWIDDWDTTTNSSAVAWKYIADQVIESDDDGYLHDADYYPAVSKPQTETGRLANLEMAMLELAGALL